MQGLAHRIYVYASGTISLPMQGPCNIGQRRYNPQSTVNLVIWWGSYWSSSRQWTCSLLLWRGNVFITMVLSIWTEITSPQLMKATQPEPLNSHSHSSKACLGGYLSLSCSKDWPTITTMWATTEAEVPTTQPQEFMLLQSMF